MPTVHFTANLRRHVDCPSMEVPGTSVREALEAVFRAAPALRGYVLDEQGTVRKHMNIFVDGEQLADRRGLSDAVEADADIYIMQALSGG